jgi:hypothetical protein
LAYSRGPIASGPKECFLLLLNKTIGLRLIKILKNHGSLLLLENHNSTSIYFGKFLVVSKQSFPSTAENREGPINFTLQTKAEPLPSMNVFNYLIPRNISL